MTKQKPTLNQADIDLLRGIFATKDDLKGFATKDDLKGFATKDDLKNFATKDDLKAFATKRDLVAMEKRLDEKVASKHDLVAMEKRIKLTTKQDLMAMENRYDDKLEAMEKRQDAKFPTKTEMNKQFENLAIIIADTFQSHEKRISRLEQNAQIA